MGGKVKVYMGLSPKLDTARYRTSAGGRSSCGSRASGRPVSAGRPLVLARVLKWRISGLGRSSGRWTSGGVRRPLVWLGCTRTGRLVWTGCPLAGVRLEHQAPDVRSRPVVRWLGFLPQLFFFSISMSIFLFFFSLLLGFSMIPEDAQCVHIR